MITFTDSKGNAFKLEDLIELMRSLRPRFEIYFIKPDNTCLFKLDRSSPSNFAIGHVIKIAGSEYGILRVVYDFDEVPSNSNHLCVVKIHVVERAHSALSMETIGNG